ncbi:MAG: amidohydrolase 2 [Actinomycetia bacterium]|nr:amidohydrolase 2 [Actinomycetes bacterium]
MRIDFHQHVWTEEFRAALERRSRPPYLRGRHLVLPQGGEFEVDPLAYTPEHRLSELDRAGLDAAIVSLPPTMEPTPELADPWNESAQQLAAQSGGRLLPLAYREARTGFLGAIVAATDLLDLDVVTPLLDRLQAQRQLLFVHPGRASPSSSGWWASGVEYTAQMQSAYATWVASGVARWPELRVVFALLAGGAPFQIERLVRRGLDPRAPFAPNMWFDTSSYGARALELTLQTFGASRLVFGSDAPVDPVDEALRTLRPFGDALEVELLVSNPLTLLNSERRRWAA